MQLCAMGKSIPNYQVNMTSPSKNQKLPLELQLLVPKYSCVFVEPITLPPLRQEFDHRIPLKEGCNPINLRPYRYPLLQKDAIEQLT